MQQWNILINAIDLNHDKKISSTEEVQKAKELGLDAKMGQKVEEVIEKSSKMTLQEALLKIDQTQTVDNQNQKDDYLKKKGLNIIC